MGMCCDGKGCKDCVTRLEFKMIDGKLHHRHVKVMPGDWHVADESMNDLVDHLGNGESLVWTMPGDPYTTDRVMPTGANYGNRGESAPTPTVRGNAT